MCERGKLENLLEEVKQKIRMLDAIEQRLLSMRKLVIMSTEAEVLDDERKMIQRKINSLMNEIKLLEMDDIMYH